MSFTTACNTCQQLGAVLKVGPRRLLFADAAVARAWLVGHRGHDIRLLADGFDRVQPMPHWKPQYRYGPPDPREYVVPPLPLTARSPGWEPRSDAARAWQATWPPDADRRPLGAVRSDRRDQAVACPNCPSRETVWRWTVETGRPFVFCRGCGNTWGPAADDALARDDLRRQGPDRPSPLGSLQRLAAATNPQVR